MPEYELRPEDVIHKSQLHRLLIEVVDEPLLAQSLAFKGGTCAAMLGYLDRFSVDLDFDVLPGSNFDGIREKFYKLFSDLGLELKLAFDKSLFFQVKYKNNVGKRSKLKVSASTNFVSANQYKVHYFPEIDRLINSQTIETMFANKLVAIMDRYEQHQSIAGRDIYDIHHFFIKGYQYNLEVITERTGSPLDKYLEKLIEFIRKNVNQTIINEDLNSLLSANQFQSVRKVLIPEILTFLELEKNKFKSV
ncbi:MAG: nucleotidyl transferase AbiEii/AbiGii toxin family protein [Anaerolineaceae bacterium]|nr:nucleotidyl transferase AbiEii/AbiGii toxin family protein [Anaerolineaceae bacterium]